MMQMENILSIQTQIMANSVCLDQIAPVFRHKGIMVNSVDPDQTAPEGAI